LSAAERQIVLQQYATNATRNVAPLTYHRLAYNDETQTEPEDATVPRRSDTLQTVRLALELLERIPRSRKVTAAELREQLDAAGFPRDLRTVQRLLAELSKSFDIERDDRERPYGYRWKERARGLAVPGLTAHESLLLSLAEEHLRNLLPAALVKSMDAFFSQARTTLRVGAGARRERQWLDKVRVVSQNQPLLPPRVSSEVFTAVSESLYNDEWLEIDYRNASGKRTSARVMPLGLAQQGPRLLLVCRFDGHADVRNLALNRMISATATGLRFKRPREFDLRKHEEDGRFGFGSGKRIRLRIRIAKPAGQHLLESRLSADQTVVETEDAYEISATVVQTERLKWWLRGFGEEVEVLGPRGLREAFGEPID